MEEEGFGPPPQATLACAEGAEICGAAAKIDWLKHSPYSILLSILGALLSNVNAPRTILNTADQAR